MFRANHFFFAIGILMLIVSCKSDGKAEKKAEVVSIDSLLQLRYQRLLEYSVDSTNIPRSYTKATNSTRGVPSKDWCSGFFPGNLWQLFKLTGNEIYKQKAMEWTAFIEKEKYNDGTHDMGFKVYSSFGQGYEITHNEKYKEVIVQSAKTLATRFNENVGSLRSWDWNSDTWEFPVIVDNMMNLELLFEATRFTGDSTFHKIAIQHANTTLKNHVREDNSIYHVVVYDTINGTVKEKVTHQGFNGESIWARGQAWGIYGYTMAYRYTKNEDYLNQAEATAKFFLSHENLPEDGIPYWDFKDPDIPDAPRDVSAATIIASAFFELNNFTANADYLAYSKKVLHTLQSEKYILDKVIDAPFILDHSTGNWPKSDEIDEPITYADYYFLEALLREKRN